MATGTWVVTVDAAVGVEDSQFGIEREVFGGKTFDRTH